MAQNRERRIREARGWLAVAKSNRAGTARYPWAHLCGEAIAVVSGLLAELDQGARP